MKSYIGSPSILFKLIIKTDVCQQTSLKDILKTKKKKTWLKQQIESLLNKKQSLKDTAFKMNPSKAVYNALVVF